MAWTLRTYRDPDFSDVRELERVRDAAGYASAVFVRQAAALWPETFLVAEDEGGIVGFAIGAASSDPASGWVLRLKVREDRRRRGIGAALLRELLDRLRLTDVRELRLTVAPGNDAALALYRGLGFDAVSVEPGYFGPGEDRLVLALRLAPAAHTCGEL